MLSVTESALDHLSGFLDQDQPNLALRLTTTDDGLALVPDRPKPGDEIHERGGRPLLVLDERISSVMGPQTLDVAVQDGHMKLTLRKEHS